MWNGMKVNLDYQGNLMFYITLVSLLPFYVFISSYLSLASVVGVNKPNYTEILERWVDNWDNRAAI